MTDYKKSLEEWAKAGEGYANGPAGGEDENARLQPLIKLLIEDNEQLRTAMLAIGLSSNMLTDTAIAESNAAIEKFLQEMK